MIALVDDEELNLRSMGILLKHHDFKVAMFKDGFTLLEYLRGEEGKNINVIICDVRMPRISGFEVLDFLKSDRELRNIPVIMLSGYHEHSNKVYAKFRGAATYIEKPIGKDFPGLVKRIMETGHE